MSEKMLNMRGITVDVPDAYGNVDEQGNVRYLDEERLERKESNMPLYHNHPHGSGAKDAFWPQFSARPWNFDAYAKAFHFLREQLHWTAQPETPQGAAVRSLLMMNHPDKGHSGGTAYNLNVNKDFSDKTGSVVVPMDLVKAAIDKAEFIGGMNKCLCREANGCEHYPHDLACLFLGKSGKVAVKHGLARAFTKEEAYARVDRAAELGLVCMSLWVEIEQVVWGLRNDEMCDFVEICFCCPCCCTAFNLCRETTPDVRRRFGPSGFTATVDHDKCIGCMRCADPYCPQDAIQFRASDNKMVVNQETCMGCGYCSQRCPTGAIQVKQTMPMRSSVHEYLEKERKLDLAVDGYPGGGA